MASNNSVFWYIQSMKIRNIFGRATASDRPGKLLELSDLDPRETQELEPQEGFGPLFPSLNQPGSKLEEGFAAKHTNDGAERGLAAKVISATNLTGTSMADDSRRIEEREHLKTLEWEMPNFRDRGPDLLGDFAGPTRRFQKNRKRQLFEVFTPTKPVGKADAFIGRREILRRIVAAIEEEHAHVIIHGNRGIGKTSLANVLTEIAMGGGYHICRYSCSSSTTFENLFRPFLKSLPSTLMDRLSRDKGSNLESFEQLLTSGTFSSTDVAHALGVLVKPVLYVMDEFDRVTSDEVKWKLAETIKSTSDVSSAVTFVILGIGKTLEDLIGEHPSIQRHIHSVNLPLMRQAELRGLIQRAEQNSDFAFDDVTRDSIVALSKGLPYYAQLMGLHAGRNAEKRNSKTIEIYDLQVALQTIVDSMDPLIVKQYELATRGEHNLFMMDVLFAAAFSHQDPYGAFTVTDASHAMQRNFGKVMQQLTVHKALSKLSENEAGPILEKVRLPSGTLTYSFVNPSMRQYILFRQGRDRGIV